MNTALLIVVGFWVGWRGRDRSINGDDVLILAVTVLASTCSWVHW